MSKLRGLTSANNRLLQYFFHVALCLLMLCSELVLAFRNNLPISFYLRKRYLIDKCKPHIPVQLFADFFAYSLSQNDPEDLDPIKGCSRK